MLFRRRFLDGIRAGEVTLAFRRWDRPRARAGGRQRTAVGELAIGSVDARRRAARSAPRTPGAPGSARSRSSWRSSTAAATRPIWRIELHWVGEDPRRSLRERADLGAGGARGAARPARRASIARAGHGAWTHAALDLIARRPAVLAAELAASVGRETQPFKRDIRKLKELGLTESLERGYRISPRGRALLEWLGAAEAAAAGRAGSAHLGSLGVGG